MPIPNGSPRQAQARHFVLGTPLRPPFPAGLERVLFGMGCFWGAEKRLWGLPGVYTTAVGYAGGTAPEPTYAQVCTGTTGHAEVVQVVFDPGRLPFERLLRVFWESHDPTQGLRQGNDIGPQYRSAIFVCDPLRGPAEASRARYQQALRAAGHGEITTEIGPDAPFHYAEDYHQQYLARNPGGYCGGAGTGVACPTAAIDE